MKIIGVDNLDRDWVSDILVAENITKQFYADVMVQALNSTVTAYFYRVVSDDYKLYVFEP